MADRNAAGVAAESSYTFHFPECVLTENMPNINSRQIKARQSVVAVLIIFLMPQAGCQQQVAQQTATDSHSSELPPRAILEKMIDKCSIARSYQDNAVLYLTYRLNGRAIQEPHPWSVAWNRDGHFSADWFDSKIRCDGKRFGAYVYDIETGNIDNQQILVPVKDVVPLDSLFADKVARHFVCGESELPLHDEDLGPQDWLIHPMIGFLNPKYAMHWLTEP